MVIGQGMPRKVKKTPAKDNDKKFTGTGGKPKKEQRKPRKNSSDKGISNKKKTGGNTGVSSATPKKISRQVASEDIRKPGVNVDAPKKIPQLAKMTSEVVKGLGMNVNVDASGSSEKMSSRSLRKFFKHTANEMNKKLTGLFESYIQESYSIENDDLNSSFGPQGVTRKREEEKETIPREDNQRGNISIVFVANIVDSSNPLGTAPEKLSKNDYLVTQDRGFCETNHIMYFNGRKAKHVRRILWS